MSKKLLRVGLLLMLMLGGILAACGGGNDDTSTSNKDESSGDGNAKITFWDENAGPQRTPIWEELIERFEEEVESNYFKSEQLLQKERRACKGT